MSCYNIQSMAFFMSGGNYMKNLFNQIIKFGIVGFFCFFIDFGITTGLTNQLGVHYLISKFLGFVVSAIVNYILSIKFVFTRKKQMDKKKEFSVFLVLSAIGLVINEIVMYICIDGIYKNSNSLQSLLTESVVVYLSTILATGVVMVYNFISRKRRCFIF